MSPMLLRSASVSTSQSWLRVESCIRHTRPCAAQHTCHIRTHGQFICPLHKASRGRWLEGAMPGPVRTWKERMEWASRSMAMALSPSPSSSSRI